MTLREIEQIFGIDYRTLQRWRHEKNKNEKYRKRYNLLKFLETVNINKVKKVINDEQ